MLKKDILDIIYNTIKEKDNITTKELYSLGLSSFDISCLIEINKLIRIKRGCYSLSDNCLFDFGIMFLNNNDILNSENCFRKSCETNENNIEKIYKLFCDNIVNKDYNKVILLFTILNKFNNKHTLDINTIMYLLNQIIKLPDDIKEIILNNDLVDIDNKSVIDDMVKENILKNNFVNAYSLLENIYSYEDSLIKDILKEIINKNLNEKNKLLDLVKNKNYEEVINFLEEKSNNKNLSMFEEYVIDLINTYFEINDTKNIPKKENEETFNMLHAINNNDYFKALELCDKYNQGKNINNNDNLIYLLLNDICILINNISSFSDVVINLVTNNIEKAMEKLKLFLNYKNKNEIEELILNIIKLDIIDKDKAFKKTINTLIDIDNNRFNMNINDYIDNFYNCINESRLDKAKLYLNIILKYSNNEELNESIEKIFNSSINIVIYKKNSDVETINNISNNYQRFYNNEEYLTNKHNELLNNKGIIILKGLSESKAKDLLELSKKYNDMYVLYFKEETGIKLVLIYKSVKRKTINIEELVYNSNKYFEENKYMLSIINLLDIIKYSNCNYVIYFKLALLYLKTCKYDLAHDYFDVALSLCNDANQQMNISYIIDRNNNKENIDINYDLFISEDKYINENKLGNVKKRKK